MTFEPYSTSVDLAKAPCARQLPRQASLHRMFWSLGCAALSCVSIVAMLCLVEWHEPGQSMTIGDDFPFGEVVIPLGIAGIAASLAFLFSVPIFLSGRVIPATWLLPLVLFILWFFTFYDWSGLIDSGKPRYDVLDHTWQFFWYGEGSVILYNIIFIAVACKWMRWATRRTAIQDAAAFDQTSPMKLRPGQLLGSKNKQSPWRDEWSLHHRLAAVKRMPGFFVSVRSRQVRGGIAIRVVD